MASKHEERPGLWCIRWREDGRQKVSRLGRVTEAQAEEARLAKERELSHFQAAAGPAFSTYVEQDYAPWRAREFPDSYYSVEQILRVHLIPHFGDRPLAAITRRELEAYKHQRLEAGARPATVTKELRTLIAALNRAVDWEVIPAHKARTAMPQDVTGRPPPVLTREQLRAVYAAEVAHRQCQNRDDIELHRRYRWSWQLMANTGLRRTEAVHLRWRDVGQDAIRILSEPGARTKSGKWREVPRNQGADEALEALQGGALVLPQVHTDTLSRAFHRTARRAGIHAGIHALRHTYITHLVTPPPNGLGLPSRVAQLLAGHANISTTERYMRPHPEHVAQALRGMAL